MSLVWRYLICKVHEIIKKTRKKHELKTYFFNVFSLEFAKHQCIMTKQIHLIFRITKDQITELLLGDFKRFVSKEIVNAIKENLEESSKEWNGSGKLKVKRFT